jgi:hypothetical protein
MTTFYIRILLLISPWPPGKPRRLQRRVFVSLQEVLPPSPLLHRIRKQDGRRKEMVARKGGRGGIPGRNVMILGEDLIRKRFVDQRKKHWFCV